MKVAFIFHLYQPPLQEEAVFRRVYEECYSPLVKFLKSHRDFNLTLNLPLSLMELMDRFGYSTWIDDVKTLFETSRIEVLGSAAYHPLLTHISPKVLEEEIILNEMSLGYYLGSRQDFEGSPASMIKDISGFFPPELAVNEDLLKTVSDLGYKWIMSNNVSLCSNGVCPTKTSLYSVKDYSTKVLIRDHNLSNMLAFKRDLDVSDVISYLLTKGDKESYVATLDGETFGHHYRDGVALLEILHAKLKSEGIKLCIASELIKEQDIVKVEKIHESTWGSVTCDECGVKGYPLWLEKTNKEQILLKRLQDLLLGTMESKDMLVGDNELPWKNNDTSIVEYINAHKTLCSDKFWWLSGAVLPGGELLYQKDIVIPYIKMIEEFLEKNNSGNTNDEYKKTIDKLLNSLNKS